MGHMNTMDESEAMIIALAGGALVGGAVGSRLAHGLHPLLSPLGLLAGAYAGALIGPGCYILGAVGLDSLKPRVFK